MAQTRVSLTTPARSSLSNARIPVVVGVTGHRDLASEDVAELERTVRRILLSLRESYEHTPLLLISPLAEGADRLVARVGLGLGAELVVPLPFDRPDYEKDFTTPESRAEFAQLLKHATRIVAVNSDPSDRNAGYEAVGEWVARNCQILLALWDGVRGHAVGGTSSVVRLKLEREATARNLLDDPERGPVYHIVTPHHSNRMPFGAHFSCTVLQPTGGEKAWEKTLDRIEGFNRAIAEATDVSQRQIAASRNEEVPIGTPLPPQCARILDRYAIADVLAKQYQTSRLWWMRILIALGFFAVAAFVIYDDVLREHAWMLALYASLFFVAYGVFWFGAYFEIEEKFLEYRALAEGLRVQLYWLVVDLDEEAADHYLRKQRTELDWIRIAIRNCVLPIVRAHGPAAPGAIDLAVETWVRRQLDYYTRTAAKKERFTRRFDHSANGLVLSALLASLSLATWHMAISAITPLHNGFAVGIVVLLAAAGGLKSYAEKLAFSEEAKQYARMAGIFKRCHDALPTLTPDAARNTLVELGIEALRENGDWVLLHRARPVEVRAA